MRETRVELKKIKLEKRILMGAILRNSDIGGLIAFSEAFGRYIKTLARRDSDMRDVAQVLLDARDVCPQIFDNAFVVEGVGQLSALQAAAKSGEMPGANDKELEKAGAAFIDFLLEANFAPPAGTGAAEIAS